MSIGSPEQLFTATAESLTSREKTDLIAVLTERAQALTALVYGDGSPDSGVKEADKVVGLNVLEVTLEQIATVNNYTVKED